MGLAFCVGARANAPDKARIFKEDIRRIIEMKKRVLAVVLASVMVLSMAGCGSRSDHKQEDTAATNVTIFAAKSLNGVVDELLAMYQE